MAKKAEIVKIDLDLQRRTMDQNSRGYQALIAHKQKLYLDVEQHVLDLKKRADLEQRLEAIATEKAVFLITLWSSEAQSASSSSFVDVISSAYPPQKPSSPSIFSSLSLQPWAPYSRRCVLLYIFKIDMAFRY